MRIGQQSPLPNRDGSPWRPDEYARDANTVGAAQLVQRSFTLIDPAKNAASFLAPAIILAC